MPAANVDPQIFTSQTYIPSPNRNGLNAINVTTAAPLTADRFRRLAHPEDHLVGATITDFVTASACEQAMQRLSNRKDRLYDGPAAETLGTSLGISAWEARYPGINGKPADGVASWNEYFNSVPDWDRERREIFTPCFGDDPMDLIENVVANGLGKPVERARHPRYGRRMGAGLVRTGAAKAHWDYAKDDVGLNAIGHIGVVLVLSTGDDPIQRVWDYQAEPDDEGNYDSFDLCLNKQLTPSLDLETPVGSLCFLSARYLHEILDDPDGRCTLACHIAWLEDGDRWVVYA